MATRRKERINEALKRMVSQKIVTEVKDPRVGFVTITKVEMYSDLSGADVWVTMLEEDQDIRDACIKALNRMRGFFHKDIAELLRTRLTPRLHFKYDLGIQNSVAMEQLIKKARESDTDHSSDSEEQDHPEDQEAKE